MINVQEAKSFRSSDSRTHTNLKLGLSCKTGPAPLNILFAYHFPHCTFHVSRFAMAFLTSNSNSSTLAHTHTTTHTNTHMYTLSTIVVLGLN